jgi:hypothetical protein
VKETTVSSEKSLIDGDGLEDVTEPLTAAPDDGGSDVEELAGEDVDDSFLDDEDGE